MPATSKTFPQQRPWSPIFLRDTKYGVILVGNTPAGGAGSGARVQANQTASGTGTVV